VGKVMLNRVFSSKY